MTASETPSPARQARWGLATKLFAALLVLGATAAVAILALAAALLARRMEQALTSSLQALWHGVDRLRSVGSALKTSRICSA